MVSPSAEGSPRKRSDSRFFAALPSRWLEAQQRERQLLSQEILQIKGLMPLLMKRRNGGRWTAGERQELLQQLRALAHVSPYLALLILPGSVVFLPLLAWWLERRRSRRPVSLLAPIRVEESPGVEPERSLTARDKHI